MNAHTHISALSHRTKLPVGCSTDLPHDAAWPRTGGWEKDSFADCDVAIVGIPTALTSLSKSNAQCTPNAVRAALRRYSSHMVEPGSAATRGHECDVVLDDILRFCDAGDCADPDTVLGEQQAAATVASLVRRSQLVIALGGDNALTVPAVWGLAEAMNGISNIGVITFDAHHDLRDGRTNGSPIRRLIESGLDPHRVVQIGIADFANSAHYRARARELGVTVIHRDELLDRSMSDVLAEAFSIAGPRGASVHIDVDMDVCDRAVVPGCPAALPGGLAAIELRQAIRACASDPRVRSIDFAEVDAGADTADGRTVRLVALGVLEAAAGVAKR